MALAVPEINALKSARILVVGDVMLDRYWFGAATRISPEAPVPVVKVNQADDRLGGAANVARNITSIGGQSSLLGIIGNDQEANLIKAIVEKSGINNCLITDASMRTINKLRLIAQNQQLLRADFESPPSAASLQNLHQQLEKMITQFDVVIFSDYGKGTLSQVQSLIKSANQHNVPVFIDPKGADFSRYQNATLITPNFTEFKAVVGDVSNDEELIDKAKALLTQYNLNSLLVTLSERGMMFIPRDGSPMHKPARSREVFDVSGAGDTVIATIAMAKAANFDDNMSLEIANSAAGVVVSKLGTAVATLAELERALLRDSAQ